MAASPTYKRPEEGGTSSGSEPKLVLDLLAELRERKRQTKGTYEVRLIETHISWVLLGHEVYKIKKPVQLPFLDFSTFEQREAACRVETRINRRLAPRTYLGVVPIRRVEGRHTFGLRGAIVDWAVRMRRLADDRRADVLLSRQALDVVHVDALAQAIAAFHADAATGQRIGRFGAPEIVEANVSDNFAILRESREDLLEHEALLEIERWQLAFVRGHRGIFQRRILDGAVREGHGDLRLEHVFFHDRDDDVEVIDGIEFDERYRCVDVCADIAFLAMDLARSGRVDLGERFLASYARASNDFDLYTLIDFYESYRACVRAKIALLAAGDLRATEAVRERARADARRFLLLAQSSRRRALLEPMVIAVAGGIASGKSTLAEQIALRTSAPIVDADRTRKHMLGLRPMAHAASEAWRGPYAPAFSERVYAETLRRAGAVLASGRPVVIDASFRTRAAREAARALASEHNVAFRLLECQAPVEICRARLEARGTSSVSDATPAVFDAFRAGFEPISELSDTEHVPIDTGSTLAAAVTAAEAIVGTWPTGMVG